MSSTRSPRLAMTAAMRALVDELDTIVTTSPEARHPAEVAIAVQQCLDEPQLLTRAQRRSSAARYRTNLVHVHPAGLYSVVALVWRPGQRTPIHSHRSWCVVGVHEGRELERTFQWHGDALVETGRQVLERSAVTWLVAGDEDIHDVVNAADVTSTSLHVYGLDYSDTGSSILDVYEEPPAAA